jgi:hypothetical protein
MRSQWMKGMTSQTARLIKFIRTIDSASMFVKTLEGIKAGKYMFLKIKEVLTSLELDWENWQV